MAKYEKHLTGNFDEVLNAVTDGVLNGSMSASYEDGSDWTNGTREPVCLLNFIYLLK